MSIIIMLEFDVEHSPDQERCHE